MLIPSNHVELDRQCWQCDGMGVVPNTERTNKNEPRDKTCDVCGGATAYLTDAGGELADFIERHFHIQRKRA